MTDYIILSIFWSVLGLLAGIALGYALCHAPGARRKTNP